MFAILRSILAVLAGIIVGNVFNMGVSVIGFRVYFPGLDLWDEATVIEAIAQAPPGMFLFPLVAHLGGTLVGAWVAALLARRAPLVHALIIGVFFLVGGILNQRALAHPLWFAVVDLALYLPAAWLGAVLVLGKQPIPPRSRSQEQPAPDVAVTLRPARSVGS